MIRRALAVLLTLAAPVWAQQGSLLEPELDLDMADPDLGTEETVEQDQAAVAEGAVLRGLDKVSGALSDLEMTAGEAQRFGRLEVTLGECRYPVGNPSGDAYAYLVIRYGAEPEPVFQGWMIASSPALNALDHARYDVWLLRCITS
ncbi:MAG: DUF2155 domain-containing protein [Rhodobacter sp.]|nr:DUF2155 domain-containing protein [Rhodobacter sp.]